MSTRLRRLSILVASWNGRKHLELCLPAVAAQRDPGCAWELLLLDNGSRDGTADWVREHHPVGAARRESDEPRLRRRQQPARRARRRRRPGPAQQRHPPRARLARGAGRRCGRRRTRTSRRSPGGSSTGRASGSISAMACGPSTATPSSSTFAGRWRRRGCRRRGEELPFACGANMLVRRRSFLEAGGFDPRYFAYLEDVDLGWRLWAGGERIVACREAVVRHRSSATSDRVGPFLRGSLFERNALLNAYKNLDDELWPKLMPAILLTFLARLETIVVAGNPGAAELLRHDPFTGSVVGRDAAGAAARESRSFLARQAPAPSGRPSSRAAPGAGSRAGLRRVAAAGGFALAHPQALAHLRAMSLFLALLDGAAAARAVARAAPAALRPRALRAFSALPGSDLPRRRGALRESRLREPPAGESGAYARHPRRGDGAAAARGDRRRLLEFSVVIPTFNRRRVLAEVLHGARRPEGRAAVRDRGRRRRLDRRHLRLARRAHGCAPVAPLRQQNRGPAAARNRGVAAAAGARRLSRRRHGAGGRAGSPRTCARARQTTTRATPPAGGDRLHRLAPADAADPVPALHQRARACSSATP